MALSRTSRFVVLPTVPHLAERVITAVLCRLGPEFVTRETAKWVPLLGSLVAARLGYHLTRHFGHKLREACEATAEQVAALTSGEISSLDLALPAGIVPAVDEQRRAGGGQLCRQRPSQPVGCPGDQDGLLVKWPHQRLLIRLNRPAPDREESTESLHVSEGDDR